MGRRVRGNFKSLIKRLPDAVSDEFRKELDATGKVLLGRAQSKAPIYQGRPRKGLVPGALKGGLSYKVLPKSLKLKVGLVGKPINKKVYYARWVEFGHRIGYAGNRLAKLEPIKGKSITARLARLRRKRAIGKSFVRARPFLFTTPRTAIYERFREIWGRALRRAASGATEE